MELYIERRPRFEMLTYSYRFYNSESVEAFGGWLAMMDWSELEKARGSNKKAQIYQSEVNDAVDRFFPLKTVRRRSTDPPWYNWKIRKRIRQKKGIYRREGRSPKWRRVRKLLEDLVERRKERNTAAARRMPSSPAMATVISSRMSPTTSHARGRSHSMSCPSSLE